MTTGDHHYGDRVTQFGDHNTGIVKNYGTPDLGTALRTVVAALTALRGQATAEDGEAIDRSLGIIGESGAAPDVGVGLPPGTGLAVVTTRRVSASRPTRRAGSCSRRHGGGPGGATCTPDPARSGIPHTLDGWTIHPSSIESADLIVRQFVAKSVPYEASGREQREQPERAVRRRRGNARGAGNFGDAEKGRPSGRCAISSWNGAVKPAPRVTKSSLFAVT